MKIRNISIKTLFIVQLIIFLLSWIVFGLISISSTSELKKLYKLNQNLEHYVRAVDEFEENYKLFVSQNPGNGFYEEGETELTLEIKNNFTQLSQLLNSYKQHQYFFYNRHHYRLIERSIESREKLQNEFWQLKENILMLGNEQTGLISEWYSSFNQLKQLVSGINSAALNSHVAKLESLQTQYLDNFLIETIDQINKTGEEIKNAIKEIGEMDEQKALFTEEVSNFVNLANRVMEKSVEIGRYTNAGQVAAISSDILNHKKLIENLRYAIDDKITQSNKGNWGVVLFWVFLLSLSTGLFIAIFIVVIKPFSKIKEFVKKLTVGDLPVTLKSKEQTDLDTFQDDLNSVVSGMKEKINFATNLSDGNLDAEFEPLSNVDSLGKALIDLRVSLVNTKKEEEQYKIEDQKRRWINEGLAKFGEVLRINVQDINELSFDIIQNLVKYLNAAQGGLFTYNDDDKEKITLDLSAAFAYNRRKFFTKQLEVGEGLVGTCAKERKTIYLTEVPNNYLSITSGLGDSNPRSILIVPLNLEEEFLGVIELASFNEFKDYEIEFVEKIAENIASTLISVRVNAQTTKLLEESKKQAAEMAEQEEELRQNMEELQASQEITKTVENEIHSVLKAVNSTALVVEFGMDGKIININDRYLEILDIPRAEIIGVKHSVFTSKVNTEKSYIEFWERLKSGEFINTIEVIKLVNGKKLWLQQAYAPVIDMDGRPVKIINIAIDITERKQKDTLIEQKTIELTRKDNEIASLEFIINEALIKAEFNKEGKIINYNQNFSNIFKVADKEIKGEQLFDLVNHEEIEKTQTMWGDLLEKRVYKGIIRYKTPSNEDVYIMSAFTPITNEDNEVYKIYLLGQNVTEQKINNEQIQNLNEEIEKLHKILKDNNINI